MQHFEEPPMLRLSSKCKDVNCALYAVVPSGADLRSWTIQLLHRYRFVIGMLSFLLLRGFRLTMGIAR